MADIIPTEENENEQEEPKSSSGIRSKMKVIGFIVAVMIAETIIAYLVLPSGVANTTAGDLAIEDEMQVVTDEQDASEAVSDLNHTEVDLGNFSVTSFQPLINTTLSINFRLYGTIPLGSEEEFERIAKENQHRIREQVLVTVRSADMADFTDAGLGLIKRRILIKINKTLGKPVMKSVLFSDFSMFEQ